MQTHSDPATGEQLPGAAPAAELPGTTTPDQALAQANAIVWTEARVEILEIPLAQLVESPTNPRTRFPQAQLDELRDSIKQHGVIQSLLVRAVTAEHVAGWLLSSEIPAAARDIIRAKSDAGAPLFEIVAGARRYRAATAAGLLEVPVLCRALTDDQVVAAQLVENVGREDLHPLDEAAGYRRLRDVHKYSIDAIAATVGKSREYLFARLKLLDLGEPARKAWEAGKLTPSTALLVARVPAALQAKAVADIADDRIEEPMGARQAADWIREHYMLRLAKAPFDIKAADYMPGGSANKNTRAPATPIAGPCTECPKRTGANPELFGDVKGQDHCTDPTCYNAKAAAHATRVITAAREEGRTVVAGKEAAKLMPHFYQRQPDGYVRTDGTFWTGDKDVNVGKAIAGTDLKPTLIENPHTREIIEAVPEAEIKRVLRDKGILKGSPAATAEASKQRERERKARLETEIRLAVLGEIVKGAPLDHESLRVLAVWCWHAAGHDNRRRLCTAYGWPTADDFRDPPGALDTMDGAQLGGFLLACALVDQCHVHTYNLDRKADDLFAAAVRAGVDHREIRARLVKESKRAKAKKPAARAGGKGAAKGTAKAAKPAAPAGGSSATGPAGAGRKPSVGAALEVAALAGGTRDEETQPSAKAAPKKAARGARKASTREEKTDAAATAGAEVMP